MDIKIPDMKMKFSITYYTFGESTSTAHRLTFPASQKSKDLNKVPLLLQDLDRKVKKNYPAGFSMSLAYILSTDSKTAQLNLSIRENNSGFSLVDNSLKADNKPMKNKENFP